MEDRTRAGLLEVCAPRAWPGAPPPRRHLSRRARKSICARMRYVLSSVGPARPARGSTGRASAQPSRPRPGPHRLVEAAVAVAVGAEQHPLRPGLGGVVQAGVVLEVPRRRPDSGSPTDGSARTRPSPLWSWVTAVLGPVASGSGQALIVPTPNDSNVAGITSLAAVPGAPAGEQAGVVVHVAGSGAGGAQDLRVGRIRPAAVGRNVDVGVLGGQPVSRFTYDDARAAPSPPGATWGRWPSLLPPTPSPPQS